MGSIFVDTSAWYAYVDHADADHSAATLFMNNLSSPPITTNYVIDEILTLLRTRIEHALAIDIGKQFFAGRLARIIRITEEDEKATFKLFTKYRDKTFSFTDCTSFVVMQNLGITQAFTFDKHFQQMGFNQLP